MYEAKHQALFPMTSEKEMGIYAENEMSANPNGWYFACLLVGCLLATALPQLSAGMSCQCPEIFLFP